MTFVSGKQSPHGAFFVPAIPDVSIYRDDDLSFQGQNLKVSFVVTRVGDVSNDIKVEYSVKDLASERNDDKSFTGAVTIPAGKSDAEFSVPITSIYELCEDGGLSGASKGSAIPKVGRTLPTITEDQDKDALNFQIPIP